MAEAVQLRTAPNCTFTPMFTTNPPALCTAAGQSPTYHEVNNFETGLALWTTALAPANPATWTDRPWTAVSGAPDGHPGFTAFGPDPVVGNCANDLENGVTSLLTPVISIPADAAAPVRMAWDHLVSMEINYDGGNLKARVNGAANWALVPASAFTFNPYRASLAASANDNPMAGQAAWTGGDGGAVTSKWGQSQIDLSTIGVTPGSTVQFKWDVGSDGCNGWDGWYVDDARVYSCIPCTSPLIPGGVTISAPDSTRVNINWQGVYGASRYEVWSAAGEAYFDLSGKTCANPAPYQCRTTVGTGYSAPDLGSPGSGHTYLVRAANECDQVSGFTSRVAEFEYALATGN